MDLKKKIFIEIQNISAKDIYIYFRKDIFKSRHCKIFMKDDRGCEGVELPM